MRALVAGIGNIFLGDDAFGVEVARRLSERGVPEGVCVQDFGLRGFDLACALCEPWDLVILVDAASRRGQPGSVYLIDPDLNGKKDNSEVFSDPHGLNPIHAIQLAKTMGTITARVLLVGCEPISFESEGQVAALSAPVAAAVETALETIDRLIGEFQEPRHAVGSMSGGSHAIQ
ncbi:MAG: hydrogenase maturation protease [Candidatus Acidiferrales bacterium]